MCVEGAIPFYGQTKTKKHKIYRKYRKLVRLAKKKDMSLGQLLNIRFNRMERERVMTAEIVFTKDGRTQWEYVARILSKKRKILKLQVLGYWDMISSALDPPDCKPKKIGEDFTKDIRNVFPIYAEHVEYIEMDPRAFCDGNIKYAREAIERCCLFSATSEETWTRAMEDWKAYKESLGDVDYILQ